MVGSKSTQTRVVRIIPEKMHPTFISSNGISTNHVGMLLSLLLLFVYCLTLPSYLPLQFLVAFYTCSCHFLSLIFTAVSTEYGKSATVQSC